MGWSFDERRDWTSAMVERFHFFATHPLEYLDTQLRGELTPIGPDDAALSPLPFRGADLTFDEGALLPEVYHTTALVLELPFELPTFVLEKEELFDRVMEVAGFRDIGFLHFTSYSPHFVVKAPAERPVAAFFDDELVTFLDGEETYHIEAQGTQLLIFKYVRLATPDELQRMVAFSRRLAGTLLARRATHAAEASGEQDSDPTPLPEEPTPPGFGSTLDPAPTAE